MHISSNLKFENFSASTFLQIYQWQRKFSKLQLFEKGIVLLPISNGTIWERGRKGKINIFGSVGQKFRPKSQKVWELVKKLKNVIFHKNINIFLFLIKGLGLARNKLLEDCFESQTLSPSNGDFLLEFDGDTRYVN